MWLCKMLPMGYKIKIQYFYINVNTCCLIFNLKHDGTFIFISKPFGHKKNVNNLLLRVRFAQHFKEVYIVFTPL